MYYIYIYIYIYIYVAMFYTRSLLGWLETRLAQITLDYLNMTSLELFIIQFSLATLR